MTDGRLVSNVLLVQIENAPCLSLRDVQRLVGGRVSWRRMAREVSLVRGGKSTDFTLDTTTAVVDGRAIALDASVRFWTGQAYVPVTLLLTPPFQAFAEATILFDSSRKILSVTPVPEVSSPRFTAQPDRARVVFDLGTRVDYRVLHQGDGQLYLRLFGGRTGPRERLQVQNPLITAVDILPRDHSTDVIFYLGESGGRPFVTLEESPRRLTVEVRKGENAPDDAAGIPAESGPVPVDADPGTLLPVAATPVPIPAPAVPGRVIDRSKKKEKDAEAPTPVPAASAEEAALSPVHLIVIDPGHGGQDVGAVGRRGTLEKDVNLAVSRALAEALRETGRYDVRMTREGDQFVSLQDRAEFANKVEADLFISVHSNAALSSASNGFEIYFLSERASDDSAAAVARRENASLELEGPADKVQAKLAQMLWSLAKTEDLNESSELAALVHKHAKETLEVPARGVKQAGFYVLKWAKMPAVLVEGAFITNPKEEKLLRSSRYQDKIVRTVLAGVRDYERRKVQARLGKPAAGGS
jgi:N-acetylmuramoyl-L-alanine amidase